MNQWTLTCLRVKIELHMTPNLLNLLQGANMVSLTGYVLNEV